ncbi:MAG: hypothetical protein CVU06_09685 [Bacteroidetes bacterium HGW-Bacteroidetes-22]|nr:MAG: hypothetical protein CVU06_09685 [Bacteroidetes bacterium HGW-Bacteroidetes-22]
MKSIVFFLVSLVLFLSSCKNKIYDQTVHKEYKNKVLDDSLKKYTLDFLHEFVKSESRFKNKTFIIEFLNDNLYGIFDKEDTVINIQPLRCCKNIHESKGCVIEDSFTILIFDKDNVGHLYYDDSLLHSVNDLNIDCASDDILGGAAFVIKCGKLFKWCP